VPIRGTSQIYLDVPFPNSHSLRIGSGKAMLLPDISSSCVSRVWREKKTQEISSIDFCSVRTDVLLFSLFPK